MSRSTAFAGAPSSATSATAAAPRSRRGTPLKSEYAATGPAAGGGATITSRPAAVPSLTMCSVSDTTPPYTTSVSRNG